MLLWECSHRATEQINALQQRVQVLEEEIEKMIGLPLQDVPVASVTFCRHRSGEASAPSSELQRSAPACSMYVQRHPSKGRIGIAQRCACEKDAVAYGRVPLVPCAELALVSLLVIAAFRRTRPCSFRCALRLTLKLSIAVA